MVRGGIARSIAGVRRSLGSIIAAAGVFAACSSGGGWPGDHRDVRRRDRTLSRRPSSNRTLSRRPDRRSTVPCPRTVPAPNCPACSTCPTSRFRTMMRSARVCSTTASGTTSARTTTRGARPTSGWRSGPVRSTSRTPSTGLAHFVEHMLFNGTEKFPENELIDVLRSFGAAFGADINAYTGYDETVYLLTVPNAEESVETGLNVLEQWLSHATFDPDQVVAERGVVLDEWRVRTQSTSGRLFDLAERMYLADTAYSGRSPIGTDDSISAMTDSELREYYDTWYRPDNAAIVVVGDIDTSDIEADIQRLFGPATSRAEVAQAVVDITFPIDTEPDFGLLADPDQRTVDVEVTLPLPAFGAGEGEGTAAWRAQLLDLIVSDALVRRLDQDIAAGTAAFDRIGPGTNSLVESLDAPALYASTEAATGDRHPAGLARRIRTGEPIRVHRRRDRAGQERAAGGLRDVLRRPRQCTGRRLRRRVCRPLPQRFAVPVDRRRVRHLDRPARRDRRRGSGSAIPGTLGEQRTACDHLGTRRRRIADADRRRGDDDDRRHQRPRAVAALGPARASRGVDATTNERRTLLGRRRYSTVGAPTSTRSRSGIPTECG